MFFKRLDLSHANRLFVVGDIHGMFTLLELELRKVGFDKSTDHLISVGDLIDRGPESHLAIDYTKKPWFHFVRGNHELLADDHLMGQPQVHVGNGGMWFTKLSSQEQKEHCHALNEAPVIMEVITPSDQRIGIVHADFPTNDWSDVYKVSPDQYRGWEQYCLWSRERIANPPLGGIRNIDHVYFGHTPRKSVFRVGNCSWIDTGAFATGNLTVLEIK